MDVIKDESELDSKDLSSEKQIAVEYIKSPYSEFGRSSVLVSVNESLHR